jgi:short-subunit dehydrogenase
MKGKTVVIAGATSGIGEVAAEALAQMGARIVLLARNKSRMDATLAQLGRKPQ